MIKGQKQDVTVDSMLNKQCDLSYCKQTNTTVAPNVVQVLLVEINKAFPELMQTFYEEKND